MEPTDENVRAWEAAHPPAERPDLGLPEIVRERLPELKGRHVLHLSCATGDATAQLVALGAFVTAVDPSAQDLVAARANAPTAAFVHAELDHLPLELLRGRFHLVYAARGALLEIEDPDAYAHGVLGALRPGGYLLQHDEHPMIQRMDGLLHWRGDYFDGQRIRLDQLITALAQAGLLIRRVEEFPSIDPHRRHDSRAPGELVLIALRPAS